MSCDLHIHSTCSDGAVPIERLASIAARTGLIYNGVVWPDDMPDTPEAENEVRLAQARKWITDHREDILWRMNNAV